MALSSEYPGSGLNVWFKEDIQNALRAVDSANADLFETIGIPEMELYRRGYKAALRAMGEAFGIRYTLREGDAKETPAVIDVSPLPR